MFDSNLYYESGIYRTPTMLGFLSHNHLRMRERNLLIYEKKERLRQEVPLSGERGISCAEPWRGGFKPHKAGAARLSFLFSSALQSKLCPLLKTKMPLTGLCVVWRRERDSNPRRLAPQRFSRPPHSTALPSLRRKSNGCPHAAKIIS